MSNFLHWELFEEYNNETENVDRYVLISKVFVVPEERGKGIARRLMTEALAEIRATHPSLPIKLWCEPQDSDTDVELLEAFYGSFGFCATGNGAEMEI